MIGINEYFEIDWAATGSKLKALLLEQVSIGTLSEWAGRDERTIRHWLKNPSAMGIERLIFIAKFLNIDLLSFVVTKGQQEEISILENYFNDDKIPNEDIGAAESDAAQKKGRKGKPRKYNPTCTTPQQFFEKALYNEYLKRYMDYTPIKAIEEFLLYLPLIDQSDLSDFLYRTVGRICDNRAYVHKKLDRLIRDIPMSDARRYADKMHYFCLCEPNVLEVSDCVINDQAAKLKMNEYFDYLQSGNYKQECEAYFSSTLFQCSY